VLIKSKKFLIMFFLISIFNILSVKAEFFKIGKMNKTPFQYGVSFSYESDDEYYDYDLKEMQKMPDDWYYIYYKISSYFKINFTKNISFKMSFPYYIKRSLKFYTSGTESFNEGIGWADISLSLYYRYMYWKKPLFNFIKSGKVMITYLFNRGLDNLLTESVSYGRTDVTLKHSFLFILPPDMGKFSKKFSLQYDFGYTISGRTRSFVMDYSKTGFDNGDGFSMKAKINYVINRYVKIGCYYYYSYTYDDIDVNGNIVEDSYGYLHSVGVTLGWRPFGDSRINIQVGDEYPISYKDSYVAYFNPSVKFSYSF